MTLRYDVTDHIATITLDRPQVKNALNRELYARLEQAIVHHRKASVLFQRAQFGHLSDV